MSGWYSKRYGFTEPDCKITQSWLSPMLPFFSGDIDEAARLWWKESSTGVPASMQTQRILKDGEIKVVEDDRWDRCVRLAEAVKV